MDKRPIVVDGSGAWCAKSVEVLNRPGNLFILDADHWNGRRNRLPHLAVGGAGGFACRWKLISIVHPNPETVMPSVDRLAQLGICL